MSDSHVPRAIIPRETAIHIQERARLAAAVIIAAARWVELPSSGSRLGDLLDIIEALSDHAGTQ